MAGKKGSKCGQYYKVPNRIRFVEMDIVRDLLNIGGEATKEKYGLTEEQVELVLFKIDRRINSSYFRRDTLCKNAPVEALNLTDCPVTNCGSLSVDGTPCGRHFAPLVIPNDEKSTSKMIETILRAYQFKLGRVRARRKNTVKINDAMYREVMNCIIRTCLDKNRLIASRYYADKDDDVVDMAVKMKLDSAKPVKVMIAQAGAELGGILRGLENKLMSRYSQEAEGWAEKYIDAIEVEDEEV